MSNHLSSLLEEFLHLAVVTGEAQAGLHNQGVEAVDRASVDDLRKLGHWFYHQVRHKLWLSNRFGSGLEQRLLEFLLHHNRSRHSLGDGHRLWSSQEPGGFHRLGSHNKLGGLKRLRGPHRIDSSPLSQWCCAL